MQEVFTRLTGSVLVAGTGYGEVRSLRATMPDLQGIEEIRTFGNTSYIKRTRPEGVCEGTFDFVFQNADLIYEFASPTPNDPQGPVSPVDFLWNHPVTGSWYRIRFASVYPNSIEQRQDTDGALEGTITFQCAKDDVSFYYSGATPT